MDTRRKEQLERFYLKLIKTVEHILLTITIVFILRHSCELIKLIQNKLTRLSSLLEKKLMIWLEGR